MQRQTALLILLGILLPWCCRAQLRGFKNYTQDDGLNISFGYNITQDRDGFIWVGGDNGIFRFDGAEFRAYHDPPDDPVFRKGLYADLRGDRLPDAVPRHGAAALQGAVQVCDRAFGRRGPGVEDPFAC